MPINPTQVLGAGEVNAPPGLGVETQDQKDLYRAALEFERFFLKHMMKQMDAATQAGVSQSEGGDAATGTYKDMASDQMVQSMLDGGGLGLASVLYGQLAEQAGVAAKPVGLAERSAGGTA